MARYIALLFIWSSALMAKNVLVIGDSHMANPLGQYLLNHIVGLKHNVVVLGHASSAPIDWLNVDEVKHRGGVYQAAYYHNKYYKNPKPSHWKEYASVPKLKAVLDNMFYHSDWNRGKKIKPDVVIVELGANDARAISDNQGNKRAAYQQRFDAAVKMTQKIARIGAKCIWILPPNGDSKPPKNQSVLYQMLETAVSKNCLLFRGSKKYFAIKNNSGCDGYHFNCNKKEKMKAFNWSIEIKEFLKEKI